MLIFPCVAFFLFRPGSLIQASGKFSFRLHKWVSSISVFSFLIFASIWGGLVSYFRLKNQSLVLIAGFPIGVRQFT